MLKLKTCWCEGAHPSRQNHEAANYWMLDLHSHSRCSLTAPFVTVPVPPWNQRSEPESVQLQCHSPFLCISFSGKLCIPSSRGQQSFYAASKEKWLKTAKHERSFSTSLFWIPVPPLHSFPDKVWGDGRKVGGLEGGHPGPTGSSLCVH